MFSTLKVPTYALEGNSAGDAVNNALESKITSWTSTRHALASEIKSMPIDYPGKAYIIEEHGDNPRCRSFNFAAQYGEPSYPAAVHT